MTHDAPADGDLTAWPAHRLATALARRELLVVDVVTAFLDRTDRLEPTYHALVSRRPRDEVLADAAARDVGPRNGPPRSWLHGLPLAVKDLADVRGLPTTLGLWRLDEAPVATEDSDFVARLRAAGAVFVGKTNTPELGLGSHTYNTVAPTTRNALVPSRSAGGSSGGAAVAVATGMVPVADGSDFMGSLRNPPGWNGVFGLRPTAAEPTPGAAVLPGDGGLDGPISRDAADLGLMLATMSGRRPPHPDAPPLPRRVAWLGDLGGCLPTEDGLLDVCFAGCALFEAMGAQVVPARLARNPDFDVTADLWPTWLTFRHTLVGGELAALADEVGGLDRLKPEARWEVLGSRAVRDEHLTAMERSRLGLRRVLDRLFAEFDVAVLPTAQVFPFSTELHWPDRIGGRAMDTYHRWMEVTTPATLAGLPVLAVPVPTSGLPIGLQVLAPWGREDLLLAVAAAWQAEAAGSPGVLLCRTP